MTPRPAARPALAPDDVLAERYRLVRIVSAEGSPTQLWQAADEVLARPVAVRILPAGGRADAAAAAAFLEAAGEAASLSHPGLARVYDAALEQRSSKSGRLAEIAYVISEWIEGRSIGDLLGEDGPLPVAEAVRLTQEAAAALAAAHLRGVGHGRLHPENVRVTAAGRVSITDSAVAAAAHGLPCTGSVSAGSSPGGAPPRAIVTADTRDLGALLYALLTARWPGGATPQPSRGLPEAPRSATEGAVYAPRQVRAGVPRPLDEVVVRALDPGRRPGRSPLTTPLELAQALDEVTPALRAPTSAPVAGQRWRLGNRRLLARVVALTVVVVVGVVGYRLGISVGALPRRPGALDALVQPAASSVPPGSRAAAPLDLTKPPVVVRDYDPFGDGSEQPGSVQNAIDGDVSTAWLTDGYNSAKFGGLKSGVGLLIDLGRPTAVTKVQVGLVTAGADLELRTTDMMGDNADSFSVVARITDAKQVATLVPEVATTARYWLVWFTKLPKAADGRFRDGISELLFTGGATVQP